MIKSFKHKGLENFFLTGNVKGISPEHSSKIRRILSDLNAISEIKDMNKPSYKLHPLKGDLKDHWSVSVNGNYRITFIFENGDAYVLNYQDYH